MQPISSAVHTEFFQAKMPPIQPNNNPVAAAPQWSLLNPSSWPCFRREPAILPPVYYVSQRDGNINNFIRLSQFQILRRQLEEKLDYIEAFYLRERPQGQATVNQLRVFREHLFSDYYADHRTLLYSQGKEWIESIARALDQDIIPLEQRLSIIYNLAEGVTLCSGGTASNLQDAVMKLQKIEGGMAAYLANLKIELLDQEIRTFSQAVHGDGPYYTANEVHYVNGYRAHLNAKWGVPLRIDTFRPPQDLIVAACEDYIVEKLTPQRVLDYMADVIYQEIEELFNKLCPVDKRPVAYGTKEYSELMNALKDYEKASITKFGSHVVNTQKLLSYNTEDYAIVGISKTMTLLKLALLEQLVQQGFFQFNQIPEVIADNQDYMVLAIPDMGLYWFRDSKMEYSSITVELLNTYSSHLIDEAYRTDIIKSLITHSSIQELLELHPDWLADPVIQQQFVTKLGIEQLNVYASNYAHVLPKSPFATVLLNFAMSKQIPAHVALLRTLLTKEVGYQVDSTAKETRQALENAIKTGDLEMLQALLRAGADAASIDKRGQTLFMFAVVQGHPCIVEHLVQAGIDPRNQITEKGVTPLMLAAERGDLALVNYFLKIGFSAKEISHSGVSTLEYAVRSNNTDIVDLLLARTDDTYQQQQQLRKAIVFGSYDRMHTKMLTHVLDKLLVNAEEKSNSLLAKVAYGFVDKRFAVALVSHPIIKEMLNNQDEAGNTAIMHAIRNGASSDVIQVLIDNEADLFLANHAGETALSLALTRRALSITKAVTRAMINHTPQQRVDVNSLSDKTGYNVLMLAASKGDGVFLKECLEVGVDPNLTDHSGKAALVYAVESLNAKDTLNTLKLFLDKITDQKQISDALQVIKKKKGRDFDASCSLLEKAWGR